MHDFRKFWIVFFWTVASILMVAAGFNWLIDPYGIFGTPQIMGINSNKTEGANYERVYKAFDIQRKQPATLIIGNSRTLYGLNPDHPGIKFRPAYNASLSNLSPEEALAYIKHAQNISPLKQVILATDFFTFNRYFRLPESFSEQRLAFSGAFDRTVARLADWKNSLVSWKALGDSFGTLKTQHKPPVIHSNGQFGSDYYAQWVAEVGGPHSASLNIYEETYFAYKYRPPPDYDYFLFDDKGVSPKLDVLQAIIEYCDTQNILMSIHISPSHARIWEIIRILKLWPEFEKFKRELVKIVDARNERLPKKTAISLWDFSGYNSITTEPFPPLNSPKSVMKGYWESTHYKSEIGDLVLDKMLKLDNPNIPPEFGVLITGANIEKHLETLRAQQAKYQLDGRSDIDELEALASRVRTIYRITKW